MCSKQIQQKTERHAWNVVPGDQNAHGTFLKHAILSNFYMTTSIHFTNWKYSENEFHCCSKISLMLELTISICKKKTICYGTQQEILILQYHWQFYSCSPCIYDHALHLPGDVASYQYFRYHNDFIFNTVKPAQVR